MKRAFVFSLDAVMVLGLVLTLTLFIAALSFSYSNPELRYQRMYYAGKDMLNVISEVRINSLLDNPVVKDYISSGILVEDDLNKTLLDVIGSLWAKGNITEARNLTNSTFAQILNGTNFDYELLIDGQEIFEKNTSLGTSYLSKLSAIVSGYEIGKPVSGYSARTRLTKANRVSSYYIYFGGYIGDGNITVNFTLPEFDNILNSTMEMSVGNNFSLYINGNYAGTYLKNSKTNISADRWWIENDYLNYFVQGNNTIEINFTGNQSMYIGGGYIKIAYNTSKLAESQEIFGENATKTEMLHGIDGIVNEYSSFYVPGALKNMTIYLHYKSNFTIFMTVGNKTIYEGNSSLEGEKSVIMDDSYLSGILDYSEISNKTIPYRIGLLNVSYITIGIYGIGDPVLVTDVSGSMDYCAVYNPTPPYLQPLTCRYDCLIGGRKYCDISNPSQCTGNVCGGLCWPSASGHTVCYSKLTIAKDADKKFVDIILNESVQGNRVGLVSYSTSISGYLNLTNNETLLNNTINLYDAGGSTCICCGINRATQMLKDLSDNTRRRIQVVMTDGEANVRCTENRANADMNGDGTINAKDDTINASCMAYQNYGIKIYTVGFAESESEVDANTLNLTAQCAGGKYYYSNVTELAETFQQIALEIINASYVAQTVEVMGEPNISKLYPDSYIKIVYDSFVAKPGYGEVMLTFESPTIENMSGEEIITHNDTGTKDGWYFIPENMQVVDAKVTSYSSNYWTDRLYVNSSNTADWTRVYWLADYNMNYTSLGDPFIVQIPVQYIGTGNNSIRIGTGLSSINGTGGSPDDRIIYTLK
ncbi:MAG: VWA domain-containing protein, partial [Candidatus Aenigmatarchaeota archaeon]